MDNSFSTAPYHKSHINILIYNHPMPEYRRSYVEGGTYFFTVVTYQRQPFLTGELVERAIDWPYSSFARYVKEGIYGEGWVGGNEGRLQGWRGSEDFLVGWKPTLANTPSGFSTFNRAISSGKYSIDTLMIPYDPEKLQLIPDYFIYPLVEQ